MNLSTTTKRRAGSAVAVAVSMSLTLGATAHATPEQGGTAPSGPAEQGGTAPSGPSEQGGTAPSGPSEQGGTTPTAPPAPPAYNPGPGLVPGPPAGTYDTAPTTPTYPQTSYNPVPQGNLHAPRPTPPVKRIAPPPDHIRIGNAVMAVKDLPNLPVKKKDRDKAIVSINEWAAYGEAEIARGLISIGVPEDEASRQAAATIIGVAAGGGIGFAVGFTGTAIITGPVIIPVAAGIGCGVGAVVGAGNPLLTLNGCGGGALVGAGVTVALATGVGALTALAGAVGGGALAWALGAGDKDAHPNRPGMPQLMPSPKHHKPETITIVNPEANQFEVHMPREVAKSAGLPAVDYVVNKRGDVNLQVGTTRVGWTAEQAQAPIRALESVAPGAERAINNGVRAVTRELAKAVPNLDVQWPQEAPKAKSSGPRHAR